MQIIWLEHKNISLWAILYCETLKILYYKYFFQQNKKHQDMFNFLESCNLLLYLTDLQICILLVFNNGMLFLLLLITGRKGALIKHSLVSFYLYTKFTLALFGICYTRM